MAAIGQRWADEIRAKAAEAGMTEADLDQIAAAHRYGYFSASISHKVARIIESRVEDRIEAKRATDVGMRPGTPMATERQIEYAWALIQRRTRDGDIEATSIRGPRDRDGLAQMTRADISLYIDDLKGDL